MGAKLCRALCPCLRDTSQDYVYDKRTRQWKKKSSATVAGVLDSYLSGVEKEGGKGTRGLRAVREKDLKLACRHKKCPEKKRFARNLDRAKHEQKFHPCHIGILEETISTGVSRAICTCPKPARRSVGTDVQGSIKIAQARQHKWDRSHDPHAGEREKKARRTAMARAEKDRQAREIEEVRAEAEAAVAREEAEKQDRLDKKYGRGRYDRHSASYDPDSDSDVDEERIAAELERWRRNRPKRSTWCYYRLLGCCVQFGCMSQLGAEKARGNCCKQALAKCCDACCGRFKRCFYKWCGCPIDVVMFFVHTYRKIKKLRADEADVLARQKARIAARHAAEEAAQAEALAKERDADHEFKKSLHGGRRRRSSIFRDMKAMIMATKEYEQAEKDKQEKRGSVHVVQGSAARGFLTRSLSRKSMKNAAGAGSSTLADMRRSVKDLTAAGDVGRRPQSAPAGGTGRRGRRKKGAPAGVRRGGGGAAAYAASMASQVTGASARHGTSFQRSRHYVSSEAQKGVATEERVRAMRVKTLKKELRTRGLDTGGGKDALKERLMHAIDMEDAERHRNAALHSNPHYQKAHESARKASSSGGAPGRRGRRGSLQLAADALAAAAAAVTGGGRKKKKKKKKKRKKKKHAHDVLVI